MITNTARFDKWKDILDRFEAGELIDTSATKMLQDLRDKERKEFEETCQKGK
jgi:hypothetical protein